MNRETGSLKSGKVCAVKFRQSIVNFENLLRHSYIMEPVTVDLIYNSRKRYNISGLVSLSTRFIFLISRRPTFVFIAYRMQFVDTQNDVLYRVQPHIC